MFDHAYGRCWVHEDCVSHPEIGSACGPNPPELLVFDYAWAGVDECVRATFYVPVGGSGHVVTGSLFDCGWAVGGDGVGDGDSAPEFFGRGHPLGRHYDGDGGVWWVGDGDGMGNDLVPHDEIVADILAANPGAPLFMEHVAELRQ